MSQHEIRTEVSRDAVDALEAVLLEQGVAEWSIFEDALKRRAWLVGIFPERHAAQAAWLVLRRKLPEGVSKKISEREIADEDWRESYKAHFKPWRCGTLHWVPEWQRATHAIPRGDVAVYLDPGLAFGTGNHETTRLCVIRLVEFARACSPRRRRALRVIDAGCGSGILAISAAKLGIENVFAFDNDAAAVAIARENARRNGVASRVRTATGDVGTLLARRRGDLVLANILADVLVAHARELLRAVAPGGALVLSGILARERSAVRAAFASLAPGSRVRSRRRGEWADLMISPR